MCDGGFYIDLTDWCRFHGHDCGYCADSGRLAFVLSELDYGCRSKSLLILDI
jgi:hypothetical protein